MERRKGGPRIHLNAGGSGLLRGAQAGAQHHRALGSPQRLEAGLLDDPGEII